jgi:hypothetical protein
MTTDVKAGLYGLCVSASPDYLMTLMNFFTKGLPQTKPSKAKPAVTGRLKLGLGLGLELALFVYNSLPTHHNSIALYTLISSHCISILTKYHQKIFNRYQAIAINSKTLGLGLGLG